MGHLPKPNGFSGSPPAAVVVNDDVLVLVAVEAAAAAVARGREAGLSSALRSEKLSEVLIKLERLSKLTDPLIT